MKSEGSESESATRCEMKSEKKSESDRRGTSESESLESVFDCVKLENESVKSESDEKSESESVKVE